MNIYIDLEATQFSKEIIALGAVSDISDRTFYSLIMPKDLKKITPFIVRLTNLTHDLFTEDVKNVDTVFSLFLKWVNSFNENVHFFVYGSYDIYLLQAEFKRYPENKSLEYILRNVSDLAAVSSKILYKVQETVGLLTSVCYITNTEVIQTHNALEDAELLKILHMYLKDVSLDMLCEYEENYFVNKYVKRYKKKKLKNNKLKSFFDTLCDLELENLSYMQIGKIIGFSHVEDRIKRDYYNLTGYEWKEDIYEKL